ncbi:hypothetical protein [Legionella sp. CNM-4043-24]|uniref:hypothetical protein n=1 Tax=Legionella sp. CNM-4043-24 TaxID=3421646 RepID=UPI00403A93D2
MLFTLPLYEILKENTQKIYEIFSNKAGLFEWPDYPKLQELIEGLDRLKAPFLPGADRPETVENKTILMGALLFYHYYPSSREVRKFLSDVFSINARQQPDAYTIVTCCSAYYHFLKVTFSIDLRKAASPESAMLLRSKLESIVELTEQKRAAAQALCDQLVFFPFIQSVLSQLQEFSEEAEATLDLLEPLVNEQFKQHGTLDYFDMLTCLKRIETSRLMRHFMEEYFIPNRMTSGNWRPLIKYQVELCSQFALSGAYVLVLEETKCQLTMRYLRQTLQQVLTELEFGEKKEKAEALSLLYTFVCLSDTLHINPAGWPDISRFTQRLRAECEKARTGIRYGRHKLLVQHEALRLYETVKYICYYPKTPEHPFQLFIRGEPMGKNKFKALIDCLRNNREPLVLLLEGLLVEGRIPVSAEETGDPHAHWEQRAHDAISRYGEAARDPDLRELVNYLLWEIKTTSPYASVQQRLGLCDLGPSMRYTPAYARTDKRAHSLPPVKSVLFFKPEPLPDAVEITAASSSGHQP